MNHGLIGRNEQLPDNMEDLSKFVLVGREKISAVRAEIRAIDKLGLAEGVRRQKLAEAQMISEAVLDAEVKIGLLTAQLSKATQAKGNQHTGKWKSDTAAGNPKTKSERIKELGLSVKQVERFEKLARHPEIIRQVKAAARECDEIVSRASVLQKIAEYTKPHVTHNSGNQEWYTPAKYIEAARAVMGGIDLDPASNAIANRIVRADTYYTAEMDGLKQPWQGRVWLNPPYAGQLIPQFVAKLQCHLERGEIEQAIVLVNNATETAWFFSLTQIASAVVFPRSRVRFRLANGEAGHPLQGQAVIYAGPNRHKFREVFGPFGWTAFL